MKNYQYNIQMKMHCERWTDNSYNDCKLCKLRLQKITDVNNQL